MDFLEKQIVKSEKNKIGLYIFFICLVAFIVFGMLSGDLNKIIKPLKSVDKISEMKTGDFVNFTVEELYDSGYDHLEGTKVTGAYGIAVFDEKYLIVHLNSGQLKKIGTGVVTIKGTVEDLADYEYEMIDDIAKELSESEGYEDYELDEIRSAFANLKVYHNSQYLISTIISYIGIAVIALLLYLASKAFTIKKNYKTSKLYKTLISTGNAEKIEMEVNNEVKAGTALFLDKRSLITSKHIFIFNGGTGFYYPEEKLLWCYKLITQRRVNGIPSGKSYSVRLAFDNKKMHDIAAKNEKAVEEMLYEIKTKKPKMIIGFTKEASAAYGEEIKKRG